MEENWIHVQPQDYPHAELGGSCEELAMSPSPVRLPANEEEEEQAGETGATSHPVMYICPAAADAARESSRVLLQSLLRQGTAAPAPTPPMHAQPLMPTQTIPLAITWHATPAPAAPPPPFTLLPHKKRMRDTAGLAELPLEDGGGRAMGTHTCAGVPNHRVVAAAEKRSRLDGGGTFAAHDRANPAVVVQQQAPRLLSVQKRPREDGSVLMDVPGTNCKRRH